MALRVLHLIKSLDIGGIETMTLDFCNNAHKAGMETHVYCMGGGNMETAFENAPAKFYKRKKLRYLSELPDMLLIQDLRKYIVTHKIDVIHAHFADEGIHAAASVLGLPHCIYIQGFAVDFRVNRKLDNLKFRLLAKHADGCVALTEVLLRQFSDYDIHPRNHAAVVHNGIDPERVCCKSIGLLKQELDLSTETLLGGMVGNFYNDVRDQMTVCKALVLSMKKHPGFHFVFAGGSNNQWIKKNESYYHDCVNFCAEAGILHRVHFIGLRTDLPNIFSSLDFYVHATNYDTFGMAPVEAMFNKLPVIVNDHPVFCETSQNGKGMNLFRSKDPQDLASKVLFLLSNNTARREEGEHQHEFACKHFHIDTHVHNMKKFYETCKELKA